MFSVPLLLPLGGRVLLTTQNFNGVPGARDFSSNVKCFSGNYHEEGIFERVSLESKNIE